MDALLDPETREVIFKKSTQVGWTEIINNIIGYFIDAEPKPMMLVRPNEFDAKDFTKKRIDPMIESCECLRGKIKQTSNTSKQGSLNLKQFDGGFLKITGANAASGLRSDPVPIVLFDEIDAYPDDVQGEGDPISIATRRTDQWDDARILKGSTPAKPKGLGIDQDYDRSSQAMLFVPCPFCEHFQSLTWRGAYKLLPREDGAYSYELIAGTESAHNLTWQKNAEGDPIAETVRYVCQGCGQGIDERYKQKMLEAGRWVHRYPDRLKVRGFSINALYSPWKLLWPDLAQEWTDAQDNPEKLKAFINLRLGDNWDEGGDSFGAHILSARKENYEADVPKGVGVIVGAVDVQNNRLELQLKGFGKGEEEWLLAHEIFYGDPGQPPDAETGYDVWQELEKYLLQPMKHECGMMMTPAIVLVDSGAHADAVYDYVLPRQHTKRRIFACKGQDFLSRPGLALKGTTKRGDITLWNIGTYAAKDRIISRMKIQKQGPGYMHFPDWATDEYFEQVTSEKKITVRDKRTRTKKSLYVKTHNRNEALDLTVYCHAGLFILQQFLDPKAYRDLGKLVDSVQAGKMPEVPQRGRRVRSSGVQ
jgi:phage terminase large subunit GpA-like protein